MKTSPIVLLRIKMQAVVFHCFYLCFLACSIDLGNCIFTLVQSHRTFSPHNEFSQVGIFNPPILLFLSLFTTVMLCTVCACLCKSWGKTIALFTTKLQLSVYAYRENTEFIWLVSHLGCRLHSALWMRTQSSNIGIEMRGDCLQRFCVKLQRGKKMWQVWQERKRGKVETGRMRMY